MSLIYEMKNAKRFNGKNEFIDLTDKLHYFLNSEEVSFLINFNTASSDYMSLFSIYYKESLLPDFSINIHKGYIVITTKENPNKLNIINSTTAYCDGENHNLALVASEKHIKVYIDGEVVIKESFEKKYCDYAYVGFATIARGVSQDSFSNFFDGEILKFEIYDSKIDIEEKPTSKKETIVFARGINNSCNYRIPSLITTKNGTIIASADARFDCPGDNPNNIDRAIRISKDNGETWSDVNVVVDHGGVGREDGASAIDCSMIYDEEEEKIVMIYCHTSAGIGTFTCERAIGFTESNQKIIYRGNEEYYINQDGSVLNSDKELTDYVCDELGYISKNGKVICNVSHGIDREFTQLKTSYLQIIESKDDGITWSKPRELNHYVKAEWMKFLGPGPGTGIQIKEGELKGRLVFPIYYSSDIGQMYSCAVIYSDDNGLTWTRGESVIDNMVFDGVKVNSKTITDESYQTTEAHVVELQDGVLKIFMRNHFGDSYVVSAISNNGGATWNDVNYEKQLKYPYCQISALRVKDNNKAAYIFSNSNHEKARVQGVIRISNDYTKTWEPMKLIEAGEYAYSSLTQLKTGEIGVLYEGKDLEIKFKKLSLDELKS